MNQLHAMRDTIDLVSKRGYPPGLDQEGDISMSHIAEMYVKMSQGEFSDAKMGRWLGWAQGVLCARGILTLEECKEINRSNSGG